MLEYEGSPHEKAEGAECNIQRACEDNVDNKKNPIRQRNDPVSIDDLRKAIPARCFRINYATGLLYFARDILIAFTLGWAAWIFIPLIRYEGRLGFVMARYAAWLSYGYAQGLVFTGIWVLGHEAGHGVLSPSAVLNDVAGFLCHSALLIPYFSWQSTHRRHHIYANNLAKDNGFVPLTRDQYAIYLGISAETMEHVHDMVADAPILALLKLVVQQLFGFPAYLLFNTSASKHTTSRPHSGSPLGNSHFLPSSTLFRPGEAYQVLASDIGVLSMLLALYVFSQAFGFSTVALLYLQGYFWCNHWIVAITYLQHTHPSLPKYDLEAWTFARGALATMDRSLGWVGKHLLHNIAEYHIIHHLSTRIPQYHAEEATKAIIPLLGDKYQSDKGRNIWCGLWEAFTQCLWVEADETTDRNDRAYWYRADTRQQPATRKSSYSSS